MSKRILESIRVHSHDFTQFLIFHVSSLLAQFTAVRRNMKVETFTLIAFDTLELSRFLKVGHEIATA